MGSAKNTMKHEDLDLFLITESKIKMEEPNIDGYKFTMSPEDMLKNKGRGIGIFIKNELDNNLEVISIKEMDNLTLFRLVGNGKRRLNIFVVYGPCENKKKSYKDKFYNDISDKIEILNEKGDDFMLIGDFNAKLDYDKNGIKQGRNSNSNYLKELMLKFQLKDNFQNEDSEIFWTFEKRHEICKSILDYVLTNKNNDSEISKLKVDCDNLLTLYSKGTNEDEKTLSDHNVITFDIKNDFINREKNNKKKVLALIPLL